MSSIGIDRSGNGNNFTSNNLTQYDVMVDSPTNNFATLNPLAKTNSTFTLSEGNLKGVTPATGGGNLFGTIAIPSTNKWYFEVDVLSPSNFELGLSTYDATEDYAWQSSNSVFYGSNGGKYINGSNGGSYGASYTTNDIIGVAVDTSAGTITFYKNNSSQGAITHAVIDIFPCITDGASGSGVTGVINFGQDSSFAGNKTPQGNSDANGIGDFFYQPPPGFLSLCTKSLPSVDVIPSENFNTVLYTGTGSPATHTLGFRPNLVWGKRRSATQNHWLINDVGNINKRLASDNNESEQPEANGTTFNATSFTTANNDLFINNNSTYVVWGWKGNGTGSASSNSNGTITSQVSANVDAGFSIVTYTGSGSAGTVGTGLSQRADLIITKGRSNSGNWVTWHKDLPSAFASNGGYAYLNSTGAAGATTVFYDGTGFTSSVFKWRGGNENVNQSSRTYLSYCFHSVDGYSKVGKYVGNGNADGPFVSCGFKPAFVLIKRSNAAQDWYLWDNKTSPINAVVATVSPNSSGAEGDRSSLPTDLLSNGFKIRNTSIGWNGSGDTYIFIAFAESPFKNSNAR